MELLPLYGVVFCGSFPATFHHSLIVLMYFSCKVAPFLIRCYKCNSLFYWYFPLSFDDLLVSLDFPSRVVFCKQYLLCLQVSILIWFCVAKCSFLLSFVRLNFLSILSSALSLFTIRLSSLRRFPTFSLNLHFFSRSSVKLSAYIIVISIYHTLVFLVCNLSFYVL